MSYLAIPSGASLLMSGCDPLREWVTTDAGGSMLDYLSARS